MESVEHKLYRYIFDDIDDVGYFSPENLSNYNSLVVRIIEREVSLYECDNARNIIKYHTELLTRKDINKMIVIFCYLNYRSTLDNYRSESEKYTKIGEMVKSKEFNPLEITREYMYYYLFGDSDILMNYEKLFSQENKELIISIIEEQNILCNYTNIRESILRNSPDYHEDDTDKLVAIALYKCDYEVLDHLKNLYLNKKFKCLFILFDTYLIV